MTTTSTSWTGTPGPRRCGPAPCSSRSSFSHAAEECGARIEVASPPGRLLLHGHCHQKALVGTDAAMRVLRSLGPDVREIASGCCGMAGSFGFEKEHYDLSMEIGDMVLFPAIRAQEGDFTVVSEGVSLPAADRARHRPQGQAPGRGPGRRGLARTRRVYGRTPRRRLSRNITAMPAGMARTTIPSSTTMASGSSPTSASIWCCIHSSSSGSPGSECVRPGKSQAWRCPLEQS